MKHADDDQGNDDEEAENIADELHVCLHWLQRRHYTRRGLKKGERVLRFDHRIGHLVSMTALEKL